MTLTNYNNISLIGLGDKPYNFGQGFPIRTSIKRTSGENELAYPLVENSISTEDDESHMNESRLSESMDALAQ